MDAAVESFEPACAHDRAGRETEAIPCYDEVDLQGYDRAASFYLEHLD